MDEVKDVKDEAEQLEVPPIPEDEQILSPSQEEKDLEVFELESQFFDPEKQEDHLWKARTGLNENTLCGAIETIIFMSDRPISLQRIKSLVDEDMPLRVIHEALSRLQESYEVTHHGIRLVEVAEGYQFRTKATYSKFVQDLFKINSLVLGPTTLEVLAIIAYKQPIPRSEIDKIRGVDSSHIIRSLMDKRLVKISGRSDEMGRPTLYGTTPEFLEVFNLNKIDDLPSETELETIVQEGVGKIEDIKNLVHDKEKGKFEFDEIEELDKLSESIKSISSETEFTKSLKLEEKKRQLESGETAKSAFDLLEEYVLRQMVGNENKNANLSEVITQAIDPSVIEDLEAGPFNTPEEGDDFQMIDLETGEPIVEEDQLSAAEMEFEELFGSQRDEEQELGAALDEAFERLTGEKLSDDELDIDDSRLDEEARKIDELTTTMAQEARDLDLDLDFLSSDPENSSEK